MNITQCLGLVLTYALSMLVGWRTLAWLLTVPAVVAVLGKLRPSELTFYNAHIRNVDTPRNSDLAGREGQTG